ncbi:MAG TPA: branched-chain amino acid ABC transporter permease [Thermoplasmata archaeon]|nr:branched-chain amino acid ABC transporter permease [Thermoplasmata archaeon]
MRLPRFGPTFYGLGLVLVVLAILAPALPILSLTFLTSLLFYVALAYSINLITGLTGYVSFGQVVFMGVGGYALGYSVSTLNLPPLVGVALGGVVGFVLALGIGIVTLRFRGVYFAIATLVTALAALQIILVTPALNDGQGIVLNVGFQARGWFYSILLIVAAEVVVTYFATHGRIGYGIRAIKGDEDAARALGIDATRIKLYLFMLSGFFAGASGAVFAWFTSGVYPYVVFDLTFSLFMLAMIIVGGMGTNVGPFLGAVIVYVSYWYALTVPSLLGLAFAAIGVLVILVALLIPEGIVGTLRRRVPVLRGILE